MNHLVAENIFVSVGAKEILKGVTIHSATGKLTALLGRNGSGKSTLLKVLFGTMPANDCCIFLNGIHTTQPYTQDGLINYLPQHSFLLPEIKVATAYNFYSVMGNTLFSDFPELKKEWYKRAGEVSGGTLRLLETLLLLYGNSKFTLLDEPFTHLMPVYVDRVKEVIQKQKAVKGIIITDHLYSHILDISDEIYLMKEGKTLFLKERNDLILHGYLPEVQ